jgi:hypothetical protein
MTMTVIAQKNGFRSSCQLIAAVMLMARFGALLLSTEGSIITIRNTLNPVIRASIVVIDNVTSNITTMIEEENPNFKVCNATESHQYYCEGPEYDQFADKFDAFLSNISHYNNGKFRNIYKTASKSRCWGKRQFPLPANSNILAIGNSHTRQILFSLMCQYPTLQVTEPEFDATNEKNSTARRRGTYYIIEFTNHAKLHLVTNHALFYSRKWNQYLESLVKTKLDEFDQLIVGKINTYTLALNTTFMALMMEKTAEFEDADFTTIPPPTVYDFAQLFPGPIVAHSMMADYGQDILNREMMESIKKANRSNVLFVNGRMYIPLLGECASVRWDQVSDCLSTESGHRCIGRRGGHPDLLAWDVIEALHNYSNTCRLLELGKVA